MRINPDAIIPPDVRNALTQQMIGCIKAISPCVKSASAKLFLDVHTVLAFPGTGLPFTKTDTMKNINGICSDMLIEE